MVGLRDFFKDKFHEINDFLDWTEGLYEGKRFDTLCVGGVKPEGIEGRIFSSKEEAWIAYRESLNEYLNQKIDPDKRYSLIWRRRPELDTFSERNQTIKYIVTSRLLLIENDK